MSKFIGTHKNPISENMPGKINILRSDLANGARLLSFRNPSSPAVVIRGYLNCGAVAESSEKLGTASLTASMLMAGTEKQTFKALNASIESIGANLYFGAGALQTTFAGQCLREDLPKLLATLVEVVDSPAFPQAQFERFKMQTLTMLAIQAQDSFDQADLAFNRLFYRDHPYAYPQIGTIQTVQSITRDDLTAFHQHFYGPKGMAIAIVGGIQPEEALQICQDSIGTWERPNQNALPKLPPFTPPHQTQREHIPLEEKSQTDLMLGTLAPETMSRDYYACSIGNNILGQFGMMGRLGNSVREKAGLAYSIQSDLGGGIGPTPWLIAAGVNPDNLEKALRLIRRELQRFLSQPVTATELNNSKTQMVGRIPLSLENNSGIANALLSIERYGLSLDYFSELPGILESISREEILEVARRYWDLDKLTITSSGRAY
ncbi:MAG TPA: pitrilysin family protein [Anaerolineaceae bacterium]|nr:pitrilysin family protein [Anaerolineaceae bacterium]